MSEKRVIEMQTSIAGDWVAHNGDLVDRPLREAERLVEAGFARLCSEEEAEAFRASEIERVEREAAAKAERAERLALEAEEREREEIERNGPTPAQILILEAKETAQKIIDEAKEVAQKIIDDASPEVVDESAAEDEEEPAAETPDRKPSKRRRATRGDRETATKEE